jgi:hypothetical protein
MSRRMVGSL